MTTAGRRRGTAGRGGVARAWPGIVLVAVALVAGACSGGGGGSRSDDLGIAPGETVVQFDGAAKLHMGGTLTMPAGAKGPVGGVLIVPDVARNDRNGPIEVVPGDPIYQDLSAAVTGSGMAAFRYDRRSMGVSKLEQGQQPTFDDMVADAQQALTYLGQRSGVDPAGLAVIGHGIGGIIAMRLAASDPRVKSLVLLSTPGRPLVDVMADDFATSFDQDSAAAFRAVVATLLATGSLPDRTAIRPEHQPVLPSGQDALLRVLFGLDPVAEAAKVKAPTLVVTGNRSTTVSAVDASRLTAAIPGAQAVSADTNGTLQQIAPALPQAFEPNDHRAHGGGRPPDTATRDQPAMDGVTGFLKSRVGGSRQ